MSQQQGSHDSMGLPVFEEKGVKDALELLKKHSKDLSERSLMLDIPPGTKNGELNDMVRKKILGEAKTLCERLGIQYTFEEKG